jgi:3-methyladenine DNA glycosylase/8-oxoguanine DNA glycosylase
MGIFKYGETEIEYLKYHDKRLGQAIDNIGRIERDVTPDLFTCLIKHIVAQQISRKAASTIWGKLNEQLRDITPHRVAKAGILQIQKCGLSMRKGEYIKRFAKLVAIGDFDLVQLSEMPDHQIVSELSSLDGIGVWTAEMMLIFSLCRPNVVSWGDLAIRRGMKNLYGLKTLTREQFDRYRSRYSPFGSVASLYLWELSSRQ